MESNKEFNIRHCMLDLPLFMEFTSEDYYISTEDKYQTFCVSSSCLLTSLTVTDTIEDEL